jgi:glycosyltransferase involved in cell wall biosynthesis
MKGAICDSEFNAQELRLLGYEKPAVIPLLLDVEGIRTAPWSVSIPQAQGELFTVLFVGRINENKCQHDVIEVFRHLQKVMDRPMQLVFIGDYQAAGDYYPRLLQEAEGSGDIRFLGKVPSEDLYGWYRAADVFLCMSEHEGFGVPLIEAMVFDVPVIAYKSSVIPQTLGGAGLLVSEKRCPEIAALIKVLAEDRAFSRAVIRKQRERVRDFHPLRIASRLMKVLQEMGIDARTKRSESMPDPHPSSLTPHSIQMEGPFESSYSLAIVNREIAFALEKLNPGQVRLFATEGPGDYQPDMKQVRKMPGLESLYVRGRKNSAADVVIRNLYPPRVADMDGLINLLSYAWEESAFPDDWARSFNRHLDGVVVVSRFVKKVLIDAGVHVPIAVVGNGIPPENPTLESLSKHPRVKDGQNKEENPHSTALWFAASISNFVLRSLGRRRYLGEGFRFLHVSSGFPRKGIDVLLQAYTREFTSRDEVALVIKTFPNPHNQVHELVRGYRERMANCPEIILINEDLSGEFVQSLYRQCHALVAPSRGEGFGLPMAEAMAAGIPVITTAAGGQTDFCTEETSWLIDYRWEPARTHMGLADSVWAEPDVDHLGRTMREIFDVVSGNANEGSHKSELQNAKYQQYLKKIEKAKRLVQSDFTWDQCARRVMEMVQKLEQQKPLSRKKIKLGWVPPWNTRSEVFAISKSLIEHLCLDDYLLKILASTTDQPSGDSESVIHCWAEKCDFKFDMLEKTIEREGFDVVVIQFHFALFPIATLESFIDFLSSRGIVIIVFLNKLDDPGAESLVTIRSQLAQCHRLLVPRIDDLNRLKELGLVENVTLFPHAADQKLEADSWKTLGRRLDGMIRALVQDARWEKAGDQPQSRFQSLSPIGDERIAS